MSCSVNISIISLMAPIDSTNDQNAMRKITYSYIYTLTIKIRIIEKLETALSSMLY